MHCTAEVGDGLLRGFAIDVRREPGTTRLTVFVDPWSRLQAKFLPINVALLLALTAYAVIMNPLSGRGAGYAGVLPDRITIYRLAICAICRTEDEVADQVRRTVIHEVAHHFGIGDARLRELGW